MDQQIQQSIYEAIDVVVNKKNSQLQFDRTIDCIIEEVKNLTTGEYKVRYLDEAFSAYATDGANYKVGRIVQVLIPQNDMSQRKTILSLKQNNAEQMEEVLLNEEKYAPIGLPFEEIYKDLGNINESINGKIKEYGIYGSSSNTVLNIFENNFNESLAINTTNYNEVFRKYAKDQTMFMITAEFKTRWLYETVVSGNYGLQFTFQDNDNNLFYYYISSDKLIGNPYKYISYTPVNFVFPIDGNKVKCLKGISLYSQYFKRQDKNKQDVDATTAENYLKKIWKNGNGMSEIFVKNISMSFCKEVQTTGYSLQIAYPSGQYKELTGNLQLKAEVRYDGALIENTSSFTYYWFKRNIQVDLGHSLYNELGGVGWELVKDENSRTYPNITFTEDEISKEFKAVVICDGIRLSDTGIVYKKFSKEPYGQLIYFNDGNGNGTIKAVLNNFDVSGAEYYWSEENSIGAITNLGRKSDTISIATSNILNYKIYRCQIIKNNIEVITLETQIQNDKEDKEYDVIFNVSQGGVYTYDTAGDLYPAQIYEQPITSHSIDFSIPQNIGQFSYEWIFPNNSLATFTNGSLKSDNITNGGKFSVEFEIDRRYDYTKASNNQIELKITTNNEPKSFYYNLQFIKEGDPGTNGTSLTMTIDYGEDSPKTLTPEGEIELVVNLWYNGRADYNGKPINDYFVLDTNAFISKDYKIRNPLIAGTSINGSGNKITISANDNFNSALTNTEGGYNFNSIIQIKMNPISGQDIFNYSISGLYGVQISNLSDQADEYITGTKTVVYSADGYNPSYAEVPMFLDGWKGQIAEYSTGGDLKLKYLDSESDPIKTDIFEPVEYFNHKNTYAAYHFTNGDTGHHFLPIVFIINTFSKGLLNSWDGASVQIDNAGGSILAPQIGAGIKDSDNLFTGVLMGGYINDDSQSAVHGLYGFDKGETSFGFLENGTAFIGKSGGARILFDGTNSTITSGNFETGSSGMQIDLGAGSIEANNFTLNSEALSVASGDKISKFKFNMSDADNGSFQIIGSSQTLLNITNNNYYLQSNNYSSANSTGMRINLTDGSIDAKNFTIDANGNATFSGNLSGANITGATGTFSGSLSGADITGATGTFSGKLSAASGSFAGTLSGADITGATGTFSGTLSAKTGSIGGWTINEGSLESGDALISSTETVDVKGSYGTEGTLTVTAPFIQFDNNYIWSDSNKLRLVSHGTSSGISMVAEYGNIFISCGSSGDITLRTVGGALGEKITISNGSSSDSLLDLIKNNGGGGSSGTATAVFG